MIEYVLNTDVDDLAVTATLAGLPVPTDTGGRCDICGHPVRLFPFTTGPRLMHYRPGPPAGAPEWVTGESWGPCRTEVAA